MGKYLDQINKPNDIRSFPREHYQELAWEIREFLIEKVSATGGHLASNLGVVELTMGLHLALQFPRDEIVWDVGHQSYTHKILTGRKDGFDTLRQYGGLSGFPKKAESDCDVFDTGHASTSISAGMGLAKARDLKGEHRTIVSVIGDGSLTGGLALEALNNASKLDTNFIIVLNDNERSISENVGGLSTYLSGMRSSEKYLNFRDKVYQSVNARSPERANAIRRAKNTFKSFFVPGMFFEELGITYLGPIDGHNVQKVAEAIREAKRIRKAVVVHVITEKGRGYEPAMQNPARFHGTGPFDIATGEPKGCAKETYTDVFSSNLLKLAAADPSIVAITAAMADGVGMKEFQKQYPDRFFDVGIAEEHAVTFAAGLASGGLKPVVAIYSTFLQRAYDEIIHDVCLQDLPVVFAIDRAGIVGADGETHQGIFDLSFLSTIPNLVVMAPKNRQEFADMLAFALGYGHPIAIRYPRGEAYTGLTEHQETIALGKAEVICRADDPILGTSPSGEDSSDNVNSAGNTNDDLLMQWQPAEQKRQAQAIREEADKHRMDPDTAVLLYAVGSMVQAAIKVRDQLAEDRIPCTVVNARFVQPLDTAVLEKEIPQHRLIVTLEENVYSGGFGEHVEAWLSEHHPGIEVMRFAVPDAFLHHGSLKQLVEEIGLDTGSISEIIRGRLLGKKVDAEVSAPDLNDNLTGNNDLTKYDDGSME